MLKKIAQVLMERDGLTREEADLRVKETRARLVRLIEEGCGFYDLEDFCGEELGLEPDYMDELLL